MHLAVRVICHDWREPTPCFVQLHLDMERINALLDGMRTALQMREITVVQLRPDCGITVARPEHLHERELALWTAPSDEVEYLPDEHVTADGRITVHTWVFSRDYFLAVLKLAAFPSAGKCATVEIPWSLLNIKV